MASEQNKAEDAPAADDKKMGAGRSLYWESRQQMDSEGDSTANQGTEDDEIARRREQKIRSPEETQTEQCVPFVHYVKNQSQLNVSRTSNDRDDNGGDDFLNLDTAWLCGAF